MAKRVQVAPCFQAHWNSVAASVHGKDKGNIDSKISHLVEWAYDQGLARPLTLNAVLVMVERRGAEAFVSYKTRHPNRAKRWTSPVSAARGLDILARFFAHPSADATIASQPFPNRMATTGAAFRALAKRVRRDGLPG